MKSRVLSCCRAWSSDGNCVFKVYTWGYGDMLALGHGKDKDEATPKVNKCIKPVVHHIIPYCVIDTRLLIYLFIYL